ncbi:hypothetical protein RFUL19S_01243 [Rhizobacter fulvus]
MAVYVSARSVPDGKGTQPSRSGAGDVSYCVSDSAFKARGGSRNGMSGCPSGQRLEPFPYFKSFQWDRYREEMFPTPTFDIYPASLIPGPATRKSEPQADPKPPAQANTEPAKLSPLAQAALDKTGPFFICEPNEVKGAVFKGASQVHKIVTLDCEAEDIKALPECGQKLFPLSTFNANTANAYGINTSDTRGIAANLSIDKTTLAYSQVIKRPVVDPDKNAYDSAKFWVQGTCSLYKK